MSKGQLVLSIVVLVLAVAIGAVAGALGVATTAFIVAGGSYLLGFITMGTAQAVALWFGAAGAVLGGISALLQTLAAAATLG